MLNKFAIKYVKFYVDIVLDCFLVFFSQLHVPHPYTQRAQTDTTQHAHARVRALLVRFFCTSDSPCTTTLDVYQRKEKQRQKREAVTHCLKFELTLTVDIRVSVTLNLHNPVYVA